MRKGFPVLSVLFLAFFLAACSTPPPTMVVMVVTSTPDPRVIQVTVTPSPGPTNATPVPNNVAAATSTASPIVTTSDGPVPLATVPLTLPPSPTLNPFPTEIRGQVYIAQEDFQHGYMFWISTKKVVWVLYTSTGNPNSGTWREYPDTFVDGEPEIDSSLTPPGGMYQPKRGFGKVWRSIPGLRDQLGWSTTPEFNLNTNYVYQAGGSVDASGRYQRGPGKHFITSLSKQVFALTEPASGKSPAEDAGTWERQG